MIKKPKRINVNLLNENNLPQILGVILHNDYGSKLGTPEWYLEWLKTRDKTLGIAHYYITKDCIGRFVDTYRIAYHAGNWGANSGGYVGYEACQSRWDNGADTDTFLLNEDMMLRQAAEDMLFWKLPVNRNTVRLHKEFTSTTCPHRSWDLHGKSVNSVKDYFISKIKYYQSLGKTVDEMIEKENQLKSAKTIIGAEKRPKEPSKADARKVTIPAYTKTSNPFTAMKVGDKVTIRTGMSYWFNPQDNSGVKPSRNFAGEKATITEIKEVSVGYSKRAYLLKEFNSWILEQDLVEPRKAWQKVSGSEVNERTTPNAITFDSEGYFYLKGVKYKLTVEEVKK